MRSESAEDGRATVVGLTDQGAALIARATEIHARTVHETLTGKFSDAEQAALMQTLSRIGR
jgi:DNA-binding MarR family transcriptional regulator